MSVYFPTGIGSLLGDELVSADNFQSSGAVWFVCSVNGTDAAAPAGRDKEHPLATVGQAYTNASAGDTIVFLTGHTETRTTALTVAKDLEIVAEGSSGGIPTVKLYNNSAAAGFFILSSVVHLRNIYFPTNAQSNNCATGRVQMGTSGDQRLLGCYFECGANDQGPAVAIINASAATYLENCTFISTATTSVTRPVSGLSAVNTTSYTILRGCVFSDGTYGFSTSACDMSSGAQTRLLVDNCTLSLGADVLLTSTSTYRMYGITSTGGGRVALI